jgi:alkanesulfonate monooxygenase SsuD/methylene tetrahydromethanopterin reductase-like flavin-dependent oxidoreductase (luciferase family)
LPLDDDVETVMAASAKNGDGNAFKIGLFGPNCSGGLAFVKMPEQWDASWENNVALARLADEVGLECVVANARWKGYGGDTNNNLFSFESITWACGLLAATEHIGAYATVHVPLFHPIVAAKQFATADHLSHGRIGLNIVCGSNQDEFEMFGMDQKEHDVRYEYGQEWWEIVSRIWAGEGPFDYSGRFFNLKAVVGSPPPYRNRMIPMMNAGASPAGRAFAIRNSDFHYDFCRRPDDHVERIKETKAQARGYGHDIDVWTPIAVVCRPTRKQANEFVQYCIDNADWTALDKRHEILRKNPKGSRSQSLETAREIREGEHARTIIGRSHYTVTGTPDEVAQDMQRLHQVGYGGVAIGFVNYLDELPYFAQEVLPRLERMGLRRSAMKVAV